MPIPKEFDTLNVIAKVAEKAVNGDTEALQWLESHNLLVWQQIRDHTGRLTGQRFTWNAAILDKAFFSDNPQS